MAETKMAPVGDDEDKGLDEKRKNLANEMAGKKKSGLLGAAEGAAVGGNIGGMIGALASQGHTKTQALDTSGNGVMSYFRNHK